MPKLPSFQFYPADWTNDPVATCSLTAQGLWLRMLLIAHGCIPYGHLATNRKPIPPEQIAKRCGCSLEQYLALLDELDQAGVPSRSRNGTIYSRRMVRDAARREESRRYGIMGGNPAIKKTIEGGVNPPVNPPLKMKRKKKSIPGNGVQGKGEPLTATESAPFFELIPEKLREKSFLEAWSAWIQHRHERKPDYTETAAKRALPKLAEEGVKAAIERIDRSISNGWQGLFFPGDDKPANRNGSGRLPTRHEQNIADIEKALESV